MRNAVAAEFLKMRRSKALLLALIASAAPPAVKMLRALLAPAGSAATWQAFLASGQELTVFGLLIAVMLLANDRFTMEYRLHTAAPAFTSGTGRTPLFVAKIAGLFAVTLAMLTVSAASQLVFGALAVSGALPGELLGTFAKVMLWYAFSFGMLAVPVSLAAVWTKRFVLTAVITLGYYILVFPFHSKSLYACPFMTPVVVAAKLYGSADYIFSFDYRAVEAGVPQAAVFLAALAAVSAAAGLLIYRKSDVPQ